MKSSISTILLVSLAVGVIIVPPFLAVEEVEVNEDKDCDIELNWWNCSKPDQICVEDEDRNKFCVDKAGENLMENQDVVISLCWIVCTVHDHGMCKEDEICIEIPTCSVGKCVAAAEGCQSFKCGLDCVNGLRKDKNGCEYCRCA